MRKLSLSLRDDGFFKVLKAKQKLISIAICTGFLY